MDKVMSKIGALALIYKLTSHVTAHTRTTQTAAAGADSLALIHSHSDKFVFLALTFKRSCFSHTTRTPIYYTSN